MNIILHIVKNKLGLRKIMINMAYGMAVILHCQGEVCVEAENSAGKRLEIYRQKRIRRKRCIAAILLFVFMLAGGIIVVDKAINGLVSGRPDISLAAFENHGSTFEIRIMNRRILINTEYLNRDLERIKEFFHHDD